MSYRPPWWHRLPSPGIERRCLEPGLQLQCARSQRDRRATTKRAVAVLHRVRIRVAYAAGSRQVLQRSLRSASAQRAKRETGARSTTFDAMRRGEGAASDPTDEPRRAERKARRRCTTGPENEAARSRNAAIGDASARLAWPLAPRRGRKGPAAPLRARRTARLCECAARRAVHSMRWCRRSAPRETADEIRRPRLARWRAD